MRGNGPKCYREVEYAAFGTPLIITEGVDTNYPVPLIEGTHYFFAKNKEDIEKYVKETDEVTWQKMSKAVRKWYEENFTTEAMFNNLKDKIETLDLSLKKPSTVFIEPIDHEQYQLTYDSCKIFNPNIKIVKTKEENTSGVTLKAGDVVINELPYISNDVQYEYCQSIDKLKALRSQVLKSNLIKNKNLAILLKWRLKNFLVNIFKDGNWIDPSGYIDDKDRLILGDDGFEVELHFTFNYQRLIVNKYKDLCLKETSPIIFPKVTLLSAELICENNKPINNLLFFEQFSEFFYSYSLDLDKSNLWKIFKLWEYEDISILKIKAAFLDGNDKVEEVDYLNIKYGG